MTHTVELPIWALTLVLLFAAVTFASHFLFPSVRWFLRRRAERVVAELNKRLERPIQPFKLARRTDMIQRVIYDRDVVDAVQAHAAETGVREDVAFEEAKRYAREIVPSFSATAYFGFATRAAHRLSRFLFDVHFSETDPKALNAIDPDATVVYVMNHRSNMDYVLVTYLAARRSALSYAVGEWARVWPLQSLIRSMGAYFIRRRSRNQLYRRVLARYVQLSAAAGVTQAMFPEGGLSRTGYIGEPKLGLLSYLVDGYEPTGRDLVFVPVSINYDRVLEDRVLIAAGRRESRRFRASAPEAFLFTLRYLWRRLRGRGHRFGAAAVVVSAPISLHGVNGQTPVTSPHDLADRLFGSIRAQVPVPLVPLICWVLVEAGRPLTGEEVTREVARHGADLMARGIYMPFDLGAVDTSVPFELDVLARRGILDSGEPYLAKGDGADLLDFYARSIEHHFLPATPDADRRSIASEPFPT